ncbi:3-oxoadipate enol-lactonase [Jannaschia pagri]|uniref:3-oxoadipate enol-lactonase n=1 Tax=Jannaschia pagri TaxID=2829797 RepID=A0ABQ4NIM6_9RHOB|nr:MULTISPECIES: alpha/beta fold hydrolase [unclassified Jannaschia]GIT89614.1 3-oxoadipate enol-lactonase [Jannaschia sp. AI_61]GIT94278.1 3-oxoadipate enol-lactonase [Jannaschia sp. AI_62]
MTDRGPEFLPTARLTVRSWQQTNGPGPNVLFLGGSNFDLDLKTEVRTSPLTQLGPFVTYEPRGIGKSDLPPGDWTMEDYAQDAIAVLDAMGWDKAVVVGESFGGMTALHLALAAPDRVQALVMSSATAGGAGGASYDIRQFLRLSRAEAAAHALAILDKRVTDLAMDAPDTYAARLAARVTFETAFARSSIAHGGYARLLEARARHDVWERLPEIQVPTLVIAGIHDGQAPLEAQRNMAARLSRATLWERTAGHGVLFSDANVLPQVVAEWLPQVLPLVPSQG